MNEDKLELMLLELKREIVALRSDLKELRSLLAVAQPVEALPEVKNHEVQVVQGTLVPITNDELTKVIGKIGKKPPVPTKTYIDFWVECRARIPLGPESKFGQHVACFTDLHSQAQRNVGWACAGILEFYLDQAAVDRGCPIRLFHYGVAEWLQKAKLRWRREEPATSAPIGVEASEDEVMTPAESKSFLDRLLAKLKKK